MEAAREAFSRNATIGSNALLSTGVEAFSNTQLKAVEAARKAFSRNATIACNALLADANQALSKYDIDWHSVYNVTNSIAEITGFPSSYKEIENSFSVKLFRQLKNNSRSFDDANKIVQEAFIDKINTVPKSSVSHQGILALLLFFLSIIVTWHLSKLSTEEILNKFEEYNIIQLKHTKTILKHIENLKPEEDKAVYYVITRSVNLRAKPNPKSSIITILHPNQRVELIQRNRKWIYIKYFDYLDGVSRLGWIYKKYSRLVK